MPWGVPTGRLNGMLDDPTQPQMPPSALSIMGTEAPVAPITANGAIQHALKPGFFQQGGTGMRIAGILGDALAAATGGRPAYAEGLMQQRQLEQMQKQMLLRQQLEEQQYQHRRADASQDWQAHQQWTLDHPSPSDHEKTYNLIRQAQGEPAAQAYLQSIAEGPMQAVDVTQADGSVVRQFMRKGPTAPQPMQTLPHGWTVEGGPTPAGSGTFPKAGLTIERQNNPGALRVPGSQAFQRFATPQQGAQAQESLLQRRYLGRGLNTVSSIVETYAPRQSRGGDNTDAQVTNYTNYVARRLGINPNQPIDPSAVSRLAAAMREFETGRRGS